MKTRLAIFGLDGARYDLIEKWVNQGYLPTFQKIIEKGVSGSVKTVLPGPHSFSAWTSFATGKNPGKHGLCYPVVPDFENKKLKFIDSSDIKVKKIWNYLSEANKIVGVMDLPILYPVESVNGIMVSSWGTPALESEYTYPSEIKPIMDKFEAGTIANCYERSNKALKNLYKATDKKFDSIRWFFNNYDWDFFVNEFIGTELLHHLYSPFLDILHHQYNPNFETIVRDYYIKLDSFFKEIIERYPDIHIILMSDHGFCTNKEYIYVNNILEKNGLFIKKTETTNQKHQLYHYIINQLTKLFLLIPFSVKNNVSKFLPKFLIKKIKHKKTLNVNWDKSLAMCQQMGMIYINRANEKIKNGELSVENVTQQVFECLKKDDFLKDKIRNLYTKQDLFSGENQENLPDIVLDLKEDYKTNTSTPLNKFQDRINIHIPTRHTINALFMAYGPAFKQGIKIENHIIMDIMPTILYLFNHPIPKDVDGKIMEKIFKDFDGSKIQVKEKEEELLDSAIKNIKI